MSQQNQHSSNAWLSAESEQHLDLCIDQRRTGNDPFTCFVDVLRRSNALVPPVITGPLATLSSRLLAFWRGILPDKVEFYDLKRDLLEAFCRHLQGLLMFQQRNIEPSRLALEGFQFYTRSSSRDAADPPFSAAKRDERLEAIETIYFVTLILSTAEEDPSVAEMPEGAVCYLPYYQPVQTFSVPKRTSAVSLARTAKFFRLDKRGDTRNSVFDFDCSAHSWASEGTLTHQSRLEHYRALSQVQGKGGTKHGAVSYFVLKLCTVMGEAEKVKHRLLHNHSISIDQVNENSGTRRVCTTLMTAPPLLTRERTRLSP